MTDEWLVSVGVMDDNFLTSSLSCQQHQNNILCFMLWVAKLGASSNALNASYYKYMYTEIRTCFTLRSQNYQLRRSAKLQDYIYNTEECPESFFTALPLV